jgi:hypothetical protein
MTRPADVPTQARARQIMAKYLSKCRDNGKRPSVLALATRLGLSNTTFRRPAPGTPARLPTGALYWLSHRANTATST